MTKFGSNSNGAIWWPNLQLIQVVPLKSILNYSSWKIYSKYGVNTLGPLCLWQCFEVRAQEYQGGVSWGWALGYCCASLLATPSKPRSPRRDTAPPHPHLLSAPALQWRWGCLKKSMSKMRPLDFNPIPSSVKSHITGLSDIWYHVLERGSYFQLALSLFPW